MTLAGAALLSLGLLLPVSHYFSTADYSHGDFDYEVGLVLDGEAEQRLEALSRPGTYVSFVNFDEVTLVAGRRSASRTEVYLTRFPERVDRSWFSSDTTVESAPAAGTSWLDISAGLARDLDVSPGDRVSMPLGSGTYRPVVRRVLAIQHHATSHVAAGPMPSSSQVGVPSLPEFPPTVATMRSPAMESDIVAAFADIPKGDSVGVIERATFAREQAERAVFGERAITAVSFLAYLAVIVLALTESAALMRRAAGSTALFLVLGARRWPLAAAILAAEALAVGIGSIAAYLIATRYAYAGPLADALPPGYASTAVLACLGAAGLYLAGAGVSIVRHLLHSQPTLVLQGDA